MVDVISGGAAVIGGSSVPSNTSNFSAFNASNQSLSQLAGSSAEGIGQAAVAGSNSIQTATGTVLASNNPQVVYPILLGIIFALAVFRFGWLIEMLSKAGLLIRFMFGLASLYMFYTAATALGFHLLS